MASLSPRRSFDSEWSNSSTSSSSSGSWFFCPSDWSDLSAGGIDFLIPEGGVLESVARVDGEIIIEVSLAFDPEDDIVFLGEVRRV